MVSQPRNCSSKHSQNIWFHNLDVVPPKHRQTTWCHNLEDHSMKIPSSSYHVLLCYSTEPVDVLYKPCDIITMRYNTVLLYDIVGLGSAL
jgi:hypothetical protein